MSWSQTASPDLVRTERQPAPLRPFQLVKRIMPRGLFWRSLIIIAAPMVLLQGIVSYVFFERDVDTTTRWMARDIAADAAFLVSLEEKTPPAERPQMLALASRMLRYPVTFAPGADLPSRPAHQHQSSLDIALDEVMAQELSGERDFHSGGVGRNVQIRLQTSDGVLAMLVPRSRVSVSKPDIFILWMVGSALILTGVAIMFLRNQVRPIERLALAAEAFGKGRSVPDFKPYGASEVRRAAGAFLTMRERIERHLQQRTDMLAGVSHDLKTPLTRMKLALAMSPDTPETRAMRQDVLDMEHMLDEYLEFARGEGGEVAQSSDLSEIAREAAETAAGARSAIPERFHFDLPDGIVMAVKRQALKRCAVNLVDNALKYGKEVGVSVKRDQRFAEVTVEDDGPGIPPESREEAFRPFHRLDQSRNLQAGGVGLGLAIARDIARSHGGDVILDKSPLGGLRARIRLPL
jgi:two-component system, OmpR family, osmolarity sensor histidine kinase EnvZ